MADDPESAADSNVAQARVLLASLWEQVGETSRKIEDAEAHVQLLTPGSRSHTQYSRHAEKLRRELYETHRLIDGLHRRFPQTARRTGTAETA